ncbi:MAG: hypothetical protein GC149_15355 [Gammaproteobacteria bacterium]|nr:hypothetical protein [Gammaproteobacteria bacterium]
MSIEFYSQRLLNPFRGVMNIIRYQSAEAVTMDGVEWEIYVSNDELRDGLDPHVHVHVQTSDIRYGHWSQASGLRRGPIFPSDDFKRMEEMGAVVYEALLQHHERLPFPLRDRYELWLLDREQQPLCLVHSAVSANEIEPDISLHWRAGNLCAELFRPQTSAPEAAAAILTEYINGLTDNPAAACWYLRADDGSAQPLQTINLAPHTCCTLAADRLPQFFIREQHQDPAITQLVQAFLHWQAPWLLLLQNLEQSRRFEIEQQARAQAMLVEQHFRLYPEVIDTSFLRAARVEAMLRKSQPSQETPDRTMSTWYLELGDWSRGK